MRRLLGLILTASICLLASAVAEAQKPAAADAADLAKKLSNPISDLVSVPFQFNWYQHVGPLELSTFILNVQPVIPLKLTDDWNLIIRIIMPFIGQPPRAPGSWTYVEHPSRRRPSATRPEVRDREEVSQSRRT